MDTTPVNPETANYLDGPGLYAWLEEVDGLTEKTERLGDRVRRLVSWREGCAANFYTADQILIRLGRHISEVPDSLYISDPSREPISQEIREEICRRFDDLGEKPSAIARVLGVSPKSVEIHVGLRSAT